MEFELTEDQAMLRDSVRRLVAREYTFQRRQAFLESPYGSSPEIWRLLAQQGIFGLFLQPPCPYSARAWRPSTWR